MTAMTARMMPHVTVRPTPTMTTKTIVIVAIVAAVVLPAMLLLLEIRLQRHRIQQLIYQLVLTSVGNVSLNREKIL